MVDKRAHTESRMMPILIPYASGSTFAWPRVNGRELPHKFLL
jgi:hypothetical protein